MSTLQIHDTSREAENFLAAHPEILEALFQRSAVLNGSQPDPEEHVVFVLHPTCAEKGDLL